MASSLEERLDLNLFKEVVEELCCGYEAESSHWIRVTYIEHPLRFFTRPSKYEVHLERLENFIKDCSDCIRQPSLHQLVAYQSNTEKRRTIRGQIIHIEESELSVNCDVFACDYGFLEKAVPLSQIFQCHDEVFQIPPLAIPCQLHMCAPVGNEWTEDSVEAFKYYLGDERCKIIVKHKLHSKLVVDLINTCPDDICTMLAITGYTTLAYVDPYASRDPQPDKPPEKLNYEFKERNVDETLHVRMLSGQNLNEFYVAEVGEYKENLNLTDDFNLYALRERYLDIEDMTVDRPVLIHEPDPLEPSQRGYIEAVADDSTEATLCLVDSGKRISASRLNIKSITQELLIPAPIAIYCSAENIPEEIKPEDFFVPGFEFNITIEKVGSQLREPSIVKISAI